MIMQWVIRILQFLSLVEFISIIVEMSLKPSFFSIATAVLLFGVFFCKRNDVSEKQNVKYTVLFTITIWFVFTISWILRTFPLDNAFLVAITLNSSLKGFSAIYIKDYFFQVLLIGLPTAFFIALLFQERILHKAITKKIFIAGMLLYGFTLVFLSIPSSDYLELLLDDGELKRSEFYRENYTLLDTVNVTKSSSSKNLIFIVMESMETSFINSEKYGDLIKELEEVHDNEFNFSDLETFGGGADIYGSENTISAIISKTTGTPQLFRRTTKKTILNRVQSIWDVLGSNVTIMFLFKERMVILKTKELISLVTE